MRTIILAAASALLATQTASAQDGFYLGLGLGLTESSSYAPAVPVVSSTGTDVSLALTAGYRFTGSGPLTFGVEGNLDILGGKTLNGCRDGAAIASPNWCTLETVARLRGTLSTELANGSRLTSSLGAVMVMGTSEAGPGFRPDTTGHGFSLGFGWEPAAMPVRVDVNYDAIRDDNQPAYERDLDLVGLRVSYMF